MRFLGRHGVLIVLMFTLIGGCDGDSGKQSLGTNTGTTFAPATSGAPGNSSQDSSWPELPGLETMSDQEVANAIGFVKVIAPASQTDWTCEALTANVECSGPSGKVWPGDNLGHLYLRYRGKLEAFYCPAGYCEALTVQRAGDQIVVEIRDDSPLYRSGDRFKIRRDERGQWVARYESIGSVFSGDLVYVYKWKAPVLLKPPTSTPTASLNASKSAFGEVNVYFDQPVACDGLSVTLKGATEISAGDYKFESACNSKVESNIGPFTAFVRVFPLKPWKAQTYELSVAGVKGIAGNLRPDLKLTFEVNPPLESAQGFDFEQESLETWFVNNGGIGCRSVTGALYINESVETRPVSGQRMLECGADKRGENSFVTGVSIAKSAKKMSFSVASLSTDLVGPEYFLRSSFIRTFEGLRVSLMGDLEVETGSQHHAMKSGWTRVQVDLPEHDGVLELHLGIEGCTPLQSLYPGDRCPPAKRVLFDNFLFE